MPPQTSPGFFHLWLSPVILKNAIKVALVVGSVLNAINQGEAILSGGAEWEHFALNYLVPFCVASYSGALALYKQKNAASREETHAQQTA